MRIESLPSVPLAHLPTPLERLERLSRELGGPELLIKRDDETDLALGGNKVRKLEFLVGQALEQGETRWSRRARRSRITAGKHRAGYSQLERRRRQALEVGVGNEEVSFGFVR